MNVSPSALHALSSRSLHCVPPAFIVFLQLRLRLCFPFMNVPLVVFHSFWWSPARLCLGSFSSTLHYWHLVCSSLLMIMIHFLSASTELSFPLLDHPHVLCRPLGFFWVQLSPLVLLTLFILYSLIQGVLLVLSKVICFGSSFILHRGPYGGCHFFTETRRFCYIDCQKFKSISIIFKTTFCSQS